MRAILALAATVVLVATTAQAQFEIEDSTTASQEVKLELLNTIRTGSLVTGSARNSHEFGVKYGAFVGWQPGLSFLIANPTNDAMTVRGFRFASTVAILGGELSGAEGGFSLGLYSDVFYDFEDADGRIVTVGPAMAYAAPDWEVALNTFVTIPFNDGGIGFKYAVGGSYEITNMVAVGAEAHGFIPGIFKTNAGIATREHLAGPTVTLSLEPEGTEVDLRVGTFFGLSADAPTMAVSANLDLGF